MRGVANGSCVAARRSRRASIPGPWPRRRRHARRRRPGRRPPRQTRGHAQGRAAAGQDAGEIARDEVSCAWAGYDNVTCGEAGPGDSRRHDPSSVPVVARTVGALCAGGGRRTPRGRSCAAGSRPGRRGAGQADDLSARFRWSVDMKPAVGTDLCMHAHVGSWCRARFTSIRRRLRDRHRAPQIVAIEPGHDGWVVGSEPV